MKVAKKKKEIPKKIKVSQLADELGKTTRELLGVLKDLGIAAKTAASSLEAEAAKIVKDLLQPKAAPPPSLPPLTPKPSVLPPKKEEKPPLPVIDTIDISVKELGDKIQVKPSDLIKELMKKGIFVTINQRIAAEVARQVALALRKEIIIKPPEVEAKKISLPTSVGLVSRPPVVTIMGHVDHGKTKLLDAIRKTKVAETETGGITQHIGAYQVEIHGKKVTFIDTPGHEAFTTLRARGAEVTDIVVLVVAADDGVKPQTIEALHHAQAAQVPIIVAINKIDKPEANIDLTKKQLSELGLIPEEWGGKTVIVPISARQGTGIQELLEMILLVAEMQELKADPAANPTGVVIEAKLDKGRGPVASVLVKNGTVRIGDSFTIGGTWGKVRALITEKGERLTEAFPSTPVELLGCQSLPAAGDIIKVVESKKEAKLLAEQKIGFPEKIILGKVVSLEDFSKQVKAGGVKNLNLVIKADVQGSLDALITSLKDLAVANIRINIIHQAVGAITESDVLLAKASNAVLIAFQVWFEGKASVLAEEEGVEIRNYEVIYKLIDEVKLAMEGMLEKEYEEVVSGTAEVRALYQYSKVGAIAGCFVKNGKLVRGAKIRIYRGEEKIYEGKLESLKRFKEDIKEVSENYECGVAISGYTNFAVGDRIEAIEVREKKKLL